MQEKKALVQSVIEKLGISRQINNVVIEGADSPWLEKALIKRKKGALDVKTYVWMDEAFLYGRVYRLFIYIADVLDPSFLYSPGITPDEEKEPFIRDRYNQIWSLYVDSRMERLGIESFFDRTLRRNLFIDIESSLGWKRAEDIFDSLWSKGSFTYPEIIDLSYHLEERFAEKGQYSDRPCIERELAGCLHHPSVARHMERFDSPEMAAILNDLLSFAAYSCRDSLIVPRHYGIVILFENKIFMELIPSDGNILILTMLDPHRDRYQTVEITADTNIEEIHKNIRNQFAAMSMHTRTGLTG